MPVHTSGVDKKNGRDTNLGGPIQFTVMNQEAADSVSVLAAQTKTNEDGEVIYTEEAGDFAGQPNHCRPIRIDVTALDAGCMLAVTVYLKDFWNNPAEPESHVFQAIDTWDTETSGREVVAIKAQVLGDGSATYSAGRGHGIGAPVRFQDATDGASVKSNNDIIAVRNAVDASKFDLVTLYANPKNTIIYTANEAAPEDVSIEMQSHYDLLGVAKP